MLDFLIANETLARLSAFLVVLVGMMALEAWLPRRKTVRTGRWIHNFLIIVINTITLRLIVLIGGISAATLANQYNFGLFHQFPVPTGVALLSSIVILDLTIYWQHRIFHQVPMLWRLHRMHHTDVEYDVSTALRFHPVEMILSYLVKFAVALLIGAPVEALILFEIILNGTAMFNHANFKLSPRIDKILRLVLVTPDMHRVHHSIYGRETHSNYGFSTSWWDWLFGSYVAQPKDGHNAMQIGQPYWRKPDKQHIIALLRQPFHQP